MEPFALKKRKLNHGGSETVQKAIFDAPKHTAMYAVGPSHRRSCMLATEDMSRAPATQMNVTAKQQPGGGVLRTTAHNQREPVPDLFNLRAEEMLTRVRSSHEKSRVDVDAILGKIKAIIEAIPAHGPMTCENAESEIARSSKVRIPFPKLALNQDESFRVSYERPSSINVVGSYAHKTAVSVGDEIMIDLAVTMPGRMFEPEDYLDYRYFNKRAYYLARIAKALSEWEQSHFDIKYTHQNDNHLQPAVLVESSGKTDSGDRSVFQYSILILIAAEERLFPLTKLLPSKNSNREHLSETIPNVSQADATPFYNSSVRSEQCSLAYLKFISAASSQSASFRDACIFGGTWLRQRGFQGGLLSGGYGNFEWACTMALLLQAGGMHGKPVLARNYSSFQMFRATLRYLAATDLLRLPMSSQDRALKFQEVQGPILFDSARGINILFKMTLWSYAALRHEARRTIEILDDFSADHFETCFVLKVDDPFQRFDLVFSCGISKSPMITATSRDAHTELEMICMHLYKVLQKGLGDRVRLLNIKPRQMTRWSLTCSEGSDSPSPVSIEVGLLLDTEHSHRVIDKGPPAEDKMEAAAFRDFWGERAELRRFKDGSILETVVWPVSRSKPDILVQIIEYVIQSHCGQLVDVRISALEASLACLLQSLQFSAGHALALQSKVLSAYQGIEQQIRNLQGLPLQVRHVFGADPQLRYASLVTNTTQHHYSSPINIFIQLEGTNRWPDSLIAVQKVKIALLVKIGDLLYRLKSGFTPRLGFDSINDCFEDSAFLDIQYSPGALFRLRIHHEREQETLNECLNSASYVGSDRESIAKALSAYKRNFIQAPLHTQAIRSLCTRFPILSPSMRIMKRWCNSHLLSSHISDELTELFTVHTFVHPQPWEVPGSVLVAFLRTLSFISKWDWRRRPLIVDFSQKMTPADYHAMIVRFDAWRKIDPAMSRVAIFAVTNFDLNGKTWTEAGPTKAVAARMTRLARAACAALKNGLCAQIEALFASSLDDFDFVLHLDTKVFRNRLPENAEHDRFKNLQSKAAIQDMGATFDPRQIFLIELNQLYGKNVMFFHNHDVGSIIAGLWIPQSEYTAWRIKVSFSSKPMRSADRDLDQLSLNKKAILHDIARLGGDMLSRIDTK